MGDTQTFPSTFKVNYAHAATWRKVFLLTDNQVFHAKTKRIYDRHSVISTAFVGSKVHIYSGCRFHIRYVNRWMVGFKFGEFSWTRKLALYKAKQLRKKKKKIMKFEHVLQIYWSKGFLMSGQLQNFHTSFHNLFVIPKGCAKSTKNALIQRFEHYKLAKNPYQSLHILGTVVTLSLNILFSQTSNVNSSITEVVKHNTIRLYLIKTTRGRAQALGKPSRGQRTWSNAWTAYHLNTVIRSFISFHQKLELSTEIKTVRNYKLIQKKSLRRQRKKAVSRVVVRPNTWF